MNKLKVALCAVNTKYIHSSPSPYILARGIDKHCNGDIEYRIFEGNINRDATQLLSEIKVYAPDVVGFCTYIWNISYVHNIAQSLKECLPQLKIVFGGPEASAYPESLLSDRPYIDAVCVGDGERSFADYCQSVCNGEKNLFGIIRDTAPYEHNFCRLPKYAEALGGRIAYIESSRGCPYCCSFCMSAQTKGVIFCDIDEVMDQIGLLVSHGAHTVKFVDRTFNADNKRACEIIKRITERYSSSEYSELCFHLEVAADKMSDELVDLLCHSPKGLFQIEAGIQSYNDNTLVAIRRKNDLPRLEGNLKRIISTGNTHVHIDLIAGLPLEDLDSFISGFERAYSLGAHKLQLGFLKVLKGSIISSEAEKYGIEYSSVPPYEVLCTSFLGKEDISELKSVEAALECIGNSGRFCLTIGYLLGCGYTSYRIFCLLGKKITDAGEGMHLRELFDLVYDTFETMPTIDKDSLHDALLCDFIASCPDRNFPVCLKNGDDRLSDVAKKIKCKNSFKGKRISVAILKKRDLAVYAIYDNNKERITERYPLFFKELNNWKE